MKPVRFVVVGGLIAIVLRALGSRIGGLCRNTFDAMPDDSPPKRMASDLAAIRARNDRIIELPDRRAAE